MKTNKYMGRVNEIVNLIVWLILIISVWVGSNFLLKGIEVSALPRTIDKYEREYLTVEERKKTANYYDGVINELNTIRYSLDQLNTDSMRDVNPEDVVGYIGKLSRDTGVTIQSLTFGVEREPTATEEPATMNVVEGDDVEGLDALEPSEEPQEISTSERLEVVKATEVNFIPVSDSSYYLINCKIFSDDGMSLDYFLLLLQKIPFKFRYFNFVSDETGTVFDFIIDLR